MGRGTSAGGCSTPEAMAARSTLPPAAAAAAMEATVCLESQFAPLFARFTQSEASERGAREPWRTAGGRKPSSLVLRLQGDLGGAMDAPRQAMLKEGSRRRRAATSVLQPLGAGTVAAPAQRRPPLPPPAGAASARPSGRRPAHWRASRHRCRCVRRAHRMAHPASSGAHPPCRERRDGPASPCRSGAGLATWACWPRPSLSA